ncbi:hypothetical protein [Nocardia alni]|uniref:hypothetical protein n=1 Tax=Nocardia alni TaxID=2815723 RepID=UPI0027DEE9E8|nr:hypothetical protein [Nocardia alni]
MRSGAVQLADVGVSDTRLSEHVPPGCAVDRWAAEAGILLRAEGLPAGPLMVRFGARQRVIVQVASRGDDHPVLRIADRYPRGALPVLPDAATWTPPDLELIRAGAITADRLHPLVASALVPDRSLAGTSRVADPPGRSRLVECRGEQHRIGLQNGVLTALDHDPDEIRREELLVALSGTPLPCLRVIDQAHRHPDCLGGVHERLIHGDIAGALAVVEGLLGPDAVLRDGALRDELEAAAQRRITYGQFRAGVSTSGPYPDRSTRRRARSHPRHTMSR